MASKQSMVPLDRMYDVTTMRKRLRADVMERFEACLSTGEATSKADQKAIAADLFAWSKVRGASYMTHWPAVTAGELRCPVCL